jgi:hypothetical protein
MGESACWYWNGGWLLVDLTKLALLAVSAHGCQVFAHPLPDKTCRHHASGGTYDQVGLVMQHAASHSRLAPSIWTVLSVREEDLAACSVLGQLAWLATILVKEMQFAACQPRQLPSWKIKVERSFACLPAGRQPETWRVLLHRSPPREAPLPPRVLEAWRGFLRPHWMHRRCGRYLT